MSEKIFRILAGSLVMLAFVGILDAGYLTWEHYAGTIPPCDLHAILVDCGKVLRSSYSLIFGVPLALLGMIHYSIEFIILTIAFVFKKPWAKFAGIFLVTAGLVASAYFVYLMLFVIQAICLYCFVSAVISALLFCIAHVVYANERRRWVALLIALGYRYIAKPIFFRIDPEKVHVSMVHVGKILGAQPMVRSITSLLYRVEDARLYQTIAGISFENPVGLAAGFDYEANLTQILGPVGFGFQSVGTITNGAYEGNPRPMLGRLPESKSLMVNKGFKNLGAKATIKKLHGLSFPVPVGVSIGRTNKKELATQTKSIGDIVQAFEQFEASSLPHAYYELNISCPNLYGNVTFYPPKNLRDLLNAVDGLRLTRPVFIKMPIEESLSDTHKMLEVIAASRSAGVIFGNLSRDRKNPALVPHELAQFPVGNFSGKPTYERSNERISLAYKYFKKRFVIIGCGGIFSADDAYEKITRGASLVQLITGMIYQGPQLIASINAGLLDLLDRDGFASLSEAVGSKNKR